MKAGLLAFAALSAVAIAQPHGGRHQQLHEKRDEVVVTQYETDVVTATAQGAVVYVDQYGNKVNEAAAATPAASTSVVAAAVSSVVANENYVQHNSPAAAAATTAAAVNEPAAPAPVWTSTSHQAATSSQAQSYPAASSPASSSSSSSSNGGGISKGLGITYSPYNAGWQCRSEKDITDDLAAFSGYTSVRLYNTDCNGIAYVLDHTADSVTVMIGITNDNIFDVQKQVNLIAQQVGTRWGRVEAVAVGNEAVNSGIYDAGTMVNQVSAFRDALAAAGGKVPCITPDTATAITTNTDLCNAGDFIAANSHAFWNGAVAPQNAGPFVVGSAQGVAAACKAKGVEKNVVITESGWANAGPSFKQAVASWENNQAAKSSLTSSFSSNLYLFNAYNNPAVTDAAQSDWGMHGNQGAYN